MLASDVIMINVVSISVKLYCLSPSYMCHLYYSTFALFFLTDVMLQPTKMAKILKNEYIPVRQAIKEEKFCPHTCHLVTLRSGWVQTY